MRFGVRIELREIRMYARKLLRESEGIALELFPICETRTRKLIRATGEELREREKRKRERKIYLLFLRASPIEINQIL